MIDWHAFTSFAFRFAHGVSRRETCIVRPLFILDFRTAFVNDQKSSIYLSYATIYSYGATRRT